MSDPPRPSAAPCACSRLRRASRAVTQLYDDALACVGLRVTQLSLLRTLQRHGPLRIGELAARTLLDRTALSRNLDPLAQRMLVAVVPGRDARTREVTLTTQGIAAIAAAAPHWERAQAEVAERIGSDRLDNLYKVLLDMESLHPAPAGRAA
ncbi:MAG TPA: MarR family winged helix-turn-helix transcriptional regulator [Casimicrobiaceae bacterium]|nr:MarR family winged helix-turn-helix transcriptional regulator [Casimicrobiaceae bacterium]